MLPGYETCEATVADYESCSNAMPEYGQRSLEIYNSVGCDQAPYTLSPEELEQVQAVPPECEQLQEQCPAVLGMADPEADSALCDQHCDTVLEPACPDTTDRDGCLRTCDRSLAQADQGGCGTEQRAVFECMASHEPGAFYCTPSGGLASPADVCDAEHLAYGECESG